MSPQFAGHYVPVVEAVIQQDEVVIRVDEPLQSLQRGKNLGHMTGALAHGSEEQLAQECNIRDISAYEEKTKCLFAQDNLPRVSGPK